MLEELNAFLEPIRKRRQEFEKDKAYLKEVALEGTKKAYEVTQETLAEVKKVMHLIYE